MLLPAACRADFKIEKFNIGGEGGTDYLTANPATGRVYISRGTHVMIVDQATGKVIGDIADTPRVHGIALHAKSGHGFTTNGGDSTSTMFDAKADDRHQKSACRRESGLDGIMYDDFTDKILTMDHSRPTGTAVVMDPRSGDVVEPSGAHG